MLKLLMFYLKYIFVIIYELVSVICHIYNNLLGKETEYKNIWMYYFLSKSIALLTTRLTCFVLQDKKRCFGPAHCPHKKRGLKHILQVVHFLVYI